jgi:hypothetical protein
MTGFLKVCLIRIWDQKVMAVALNVKQKKNIICIWSNVTGVNGIKNDNGYVTPGK